MEKLSSFERVVGNAPETIKEQILKDRGERFDNQVFKELESKELKKTPEELQIISLANDITDEILKKYGLDEFNIPAKNIHIIKEQQWPAGKQGSAFYETRFQAVAIREQQSLVAFLRKIIHELLHFKSYNALQTTVGKNSQLIDYRVGLSVNTRDGKFRYFTNLNEAITEELTKRLFAKTSQNKIFARELHQTKKIIATYPRAIADSGGDLFDSDTFYANVEGKKSFKESIGRFFGIAEKSKRINTEKFTYSEERKIINTLIDKLFEKNKAHFKNREDVFNIFAKGMMTGNILPVGKLIDKTFGSGTFRKIGELDKDIKAQEKFVKQL